MDNIILTGFMGCGKTTLGIKLSFRLRAPLLDTDKEIERAQRRKISEIFEAEGEAYFRDLETEYLEDMLMSTDGKVISTGGGLPMREKNRELMKRLGKVIYLRARPDTIFERLREDTERPLLQVADPAGRIRELMKERSPFYEMAAHAVIDVDDKEFETLLNEIQEAVL